MMIRAKLFVEKLKIYQAFQKVIVVTHGKFMNAIISIVEGNDELC